MTELIGIGILVILMGKVLILVALGYCYHRLVAIGDATERIAKALEDRRL